LYLSSYIGFSKALGDQDYLGDIDTTRIDIIENASTTTSLENYALKYAPQTLSHLVVMFLELLMEIQLLLEVDVLELLTSTHLN
jgi:hypothetical protein